MEPKPFTALFERDHVTMTVTVSGRFTIEDLASFQADTATASRDRRREWTVDARRLEAGSEAFAEAVIWLRTLGHVCLLNPPAEVRRATEAADPHQAIVIRSDHRATSRPPSKPATAAAGEPTSPPMR